VTLPEREVRHICHHNQASLGFASGSRGTLVPVKIGHAAIAVLCGALLATQGWINGQLGARLHDGILAAVVSFLSGMVVLAATVPATPVGRRGLARIGVAVRKSELRWWQCLGGLVGAFFIIGQGVTITTLGVAVFTVAAVTGQLVSGLLVDRVGLGPGGAQPLTPWRILGAVIAIGAVVISTQGEFAESNALWLVVLPALAGFGVAWQSALNGLVREAAGNAFVATLVNFSVGLVALLVAGVVDVAIKGWPGGLPGEWWMYVGGPIGILVISGSVLVVRTIGVLLLSLCMVAGQLLGAVLLDLLVPARGAHLTVTGVIGTLITLVAVVVAAIPARAGSERMAA
jgi:transporter family-2 protein